MNDTSNIPTVYIDGPSAKCWENLSVSASRKLYILLKTLSLLRLAKAKIKREASPIRLPLDLRSPAKGASFRCAHVAEPYTTLWLLNRTP